MTYVKEMKPFIEFAMTLDLREITTYNGYAGAAILRMSFGTKEDTEAMKNFAAIKLNLESISMGQNSFVLWEVYIPFERDDVPGLKIKGTSNNR